MIQYAISSVFRAFFKITHNRVNKHFPKSVILVFAYTPPKPSITLACPLVLV